MGFEYALASRGLTGAVAAVTVLGTRRGRLVAKRLHLASALPPFLSRGRLEPLTGGCVKLVGRPVPLDSIKLKLGCVAIVLARPRLFRAIWLVAAAMVRVRLARCSCGRRSHG